MSLETFVEAWNSQGPRRHRRAVHPRRGASSDRAARGAPRRPRGDRPGRRREPLRRPGRHPRCSRSDRRPGRPRDLRVDVVRHARERLPGPAGQRSPLEPSGGQHLHVRRRRTDRGGAGLLGHGDAHGRRRRAGLQAERPSPQGSTRPGRPGSARAPGRAAPDDPRGGRGSRRRCGSPPPAAPRRSSARARGCARPGRARSSGTQRRTYAPAGSKRSAWRTGLSTRK